jgi:hypothetical protein
LNPLERGILIICAGDDIWNFAKARNTTGDGALNFKGLGKDGKGEDDASVKWEEINAKNGISET